jgi:hypothetical protein
VTAKLQNVLAATVLWDDGVETPMSLQNGQYSATRHFDLPGTHSYQIKIKGLDGKWITTDCSGKVEVKKPCVNCWVEIRVSHGDSGYTLQEVLDSYDSTFVPGFVFGEGEALLGINYVYWADQPNGGASVIGGQFDGTVKIWIKSDGKIEDVSFPAACGSLLKLQVQDQQGRHLDQSRYIAVPYRANSADAYARVHVTRDPGGEWHSVIEGDVDLAKSAHIIHVAEILSQYEAREIGTNIMENNVSRSLAVQGKFSLWQWASDKFWDSPWATQAMAAMCGKTAYYDNNVVPFFVKITGKNKFEDLRTDAGKQTSLSSFPKPPNMPSSPSDKETLKKPWSCNDVHNTWTPPEVTGK